MTHGSEQAESAARTSSSSSTIASLNRSLRVILSSPSYAILSHVIYHNPLAPPPSCYARPGRGVSVGCLRDTSARQDSALVDVDRAMENYRLDSTFLAWCGPSCRTARSSI
jgi:hypothetical protein